jgi:hypothetical protein
MQGGLAASWGIRELKVYAQNIPGRDLHCLPNEGRLRFDHLNPWAIGLGARHPFPRSGSVHA